MATSQADVRPAPPMRGPDFVMEQVSQWSESPGGVSRFVLADGSQWLLDTRRDDYGVMAQFVAAAWKNQQPLLVSGRQASSHVDRVAPARRLAAQRVSREADGRYSVFFHGPPSIYYLRMDRPRAAESLELLQRSAAGPGFIDSPDLLVGIDTVASEIVLVKPLPPAAAPR